MHTQQWLTPHLLLLAMAHAAGACRRGIACLQLLATISRSLLPVDSDLHMHAGYSRPCHVSAAAGWQLRSGSCSIS